MMESKFPIFKKKYKFLTFFSIHYKCAVTFVEVVFNQYFETVTVPGVEMDQFKRTIIDEMEENDEFKRKLKRELRNVSLKSTQ